MVVMDSEPSGARSSPRQRRCGLRGLLVVATLAAIAKARAWVDDIAERRAVSLADIARREGKAERHVRLLARLAFLSPRIVAAILDGTAPANLMATGLAKALPWCWAEQERRWSARDLSERN